MLSDIKFISCVNLTIRAITVDAIVCKLE